MDKTISYLSTQDIGERNQTLPQKLRVKFYKIRETTFLRSFQLMLFWVDVIIPAPQDLYCNIFQLK